MKSLSEEFTVVQLEDQLKCKKTFLSKELAVGTILALFLKRGDSTLMKVAKSDTQRVSYKCMQEGCSCCVSVRLAKKTRLWTVKSSSLMHTCSVSGATGRERNLRSKFVQSFVPELASVATMNGKHASSVSKLVSDKIGVQLGRTQAHALARESALDPVAQAAKEFRFIEAYLRVLASRDPEGTYLFKKANSEDGFEFQHTFVAPSATKAFWRHCHRGVIAVDATFLIGPFKGALFAAVTKNAQDELVLLAFGQYPKENFEHWSHFLGQVKKEFPGISLILCDKQKGLDACHSLYPLVRFGRCAKHLLDNAHENFPKKISSEWERAFWGMAKAPTEAAYMDFYKKLVELSPRPAEYVHSAKDQFAEHVFQKEGIRRFGDSTSNMAEQFFSVMAKKDFKELPILQLHQHLLIWLSQRLHSARQTIAQLGTIEITPFMRGLLQNKYWSAKSTTSEVTMLAVTSNRVLASVQIRKANPLRVLEVELMQSPPCTDYPEGMTSAKCTCGWYNCLGRPCKHVLTVMRLANERLNQNVWHHLDARWLHKAYHFATWRKQYETVFFPSTAVEFSSADGQDLLPPPMEKKKGRKGKKDKPYVRKPDQKRVVRCHGCGEEGHFQKTCPQPNTKRLLESLQDNDDVVINRYEQDGDGELDPLADSNATTTAEAVRTSATNLTQTVIAQVVDALGGELAGSSSKKVRRIVIEIDD